MHGSNLSGKVRVVTEVTFLEKFVSQRSNLSGKVRKYDKIIQCASRTTHLLFANERQQVF